MNVRAGAVAMLTAVALVVGGPGCGRGVPDAGRGSDPPVRTVTLDIRYSAFSTRALTVRAGEVVRFVVRNHDPIPHELVVGDQALQDYHEAGTNAHHPARPGELSVAAGATGTTTYTFMAATTSPRPVLFGCHLPGHWSYGMHGTVTVATSLPDHAGERTDGTPVSDAPR